MQHMSPVLPERFNHNGHRGNHPDGLPLSDTNPACQIIQNFSHTAGQVAYKSYLASCVGVCDDLWMLV